jgi:D-alanyl-D-alanine carboxypeptidase
LCKRRGWDASDRPRIVVTDGVEVNGLTGIEPILSHRSNRLADTLRRFNVYSNNDIVRIAEGIGSVDDLEVFLTARLGVEPDVIELSTASGELKNRMTVRLMTRLLTELAHAAVEQDLDLRNLLPVIGCDPGATRRMFPALADGALTGAVTCKTGTLTNTDGGVAVLAGTFTAGDGEPVVFAIAAPRAGRSLQYWRMLEQRWVLALMEEHGGAVAVPCGKDLPYSDTFAEIDVVFDGE